MKRVALVNQRYGVEVNGGSEYYTRLIAEHLSHYYEVEVLTSKALSYERWTNYYETDIDIINGITVRRFTVRQERKGLFMQMIYDMIHKLKLNYKPLCSLWIIFQGPFVPGLIKYIRKNKDRYDAIIFVTYLYYPTVMGMKYAKEKALFIPTAHDEPFIYFRNYRSLFHMPKAILYLTEEEKKFVQSIFDNEEISSVVAGIGVDVPDEVDNDRFRRKYNIDGDYLLYIGRVDLAKGCNEMFESFHRYHEKVKDVTLVVMGQQFIDIPDYGEIRYLGFVSEEDKFDGLAGAKALWLPSQYESLSIVVLEAMSLSIPVLVNGRCEVLKGHCAKSNGGMYYTDELSLSNALDVILSDKEKYQGMSDRAKQYVVRNYSWDVVMQPIIDLLERVVMDNR